MRLTVMMGLDHVEPENRTFEAARLLTELAEKIRTQPDLQVGDTIIVRDINGNRVGVADLFKN